MQVHAQYAHELLRSFTSVDMTSGHIEYKVQQRDTVVRRVVIPCQVRDNSSCEQSLQRGQCCAPSQCSPTITNGYVHYIFDSDEPACVYIHPEGMGG